MIIADPRETVVRIDAALRAAGVRFFFTGGIVSSHYGEPRVTIDVDVVLIIDAHSDHLSTVVHALGKDFIVDEESVKPSLLETSMFQALDSTTYGKVDFHADERIPGEMDRSVTVELYDGVYVPIASLEDCIMSKLLWHSMGSDKSWNDVVAVVRRQKNINWELLAELAVKLRLSKEYQRLREASL